MLTGHQLVLSVKRYIDVFAGVVRLFYCIRQPG